MRTYVIIIIIIGKLNLSENQFYRTLFCLNIYNIIIIIITEVMYNFPMFKIIPTYIYDYYEDDEWESK